MAIALRGTPTGSSTNASGTLAIPVPTGTVSGDVLVIWVCVSSSSHVPATPSGLTLLDSASTGPSVAIYTRVCDGTEGASYSFTVSAGSGGIGVAYSGVSNSSPVNTHGTPNRLTTTTTATASTITTTVNGCQLLFLAGSGATPQATFSGPAGFANQLIEAGSGSAGAVFLDEAQTTAGVVAAQSGTWQTSGSTYGSLVALAPSAGGSAPVNTVAPAVTGTAQVTQTLSTTHGTWTDDGSPTYSYQWQRDVGGNGVFTNITLNATSSTYVLVAADQGNNVRCVVTDNTPDGNTSANSNAVGPVSAAPAGGTLPDLGALLAAKVL